MKRDRHKWPLINVVRLRKPRTVAGFIDRAQHWIGLCEAGIVNPVFDRQKALRRIMEANANLNAAKQTLRDKS